LKTDPRTFILENTVLMSPPHVPEIRLHLASEAHDLWLKTEEDLEEIGLPPPFWAFAWAGGQGLARYILDHPETVAGKTVLDFASGSGLVGIAAKLSGAADVLAADIDPWAASAMALNAAENGVATRSTADDQIGKAVEANVILAGDVFYDRDFAARLGPLVHAACGRGKAGPGRRSRPQLPSEGQAQVAGGLSGAGHPGAGRQRGEENDRLAVCLASSR
jgi:predicted nicotinamide N-methyase